jgi:hypothetical protein
VLQLDSALKLGALKLVFTQGHLSRLRRDFVYRYLPLYLFLPRGTCHAFGATSFIAIYLYICFYLGHLSRLRRDFVYRVSEDILLSDYTSKGAGTCGLPVLRARAGG